MIEVVRLEHQKQIEQMKNIIMKILNNYFPDGLPELVYDPPQTFTFTAIGDSFFNDLFFNIVDDEDNKPFLDFAERNHYLGKTGFDIRISTSGAKGPRSFTSGVDNPRSSTSGSTDYRKFQTKKIHTVTVCADQNSIYGPMPLRLMDLKVE